MSTRSVSRYQRRILAWGGGLACLLYVVGAPIYLDRIERDLTDRVTDELAAAGYDGVRVSFSGQTGSISCTEPLGDPRAALDVAYSVRGVRSIADLPGECRVRVPTDDDVVEDGPETLLSTTTVVDGTDQGTIDIGTDATTSTTTTVPDADFATVLDVIEGNPQFSLLRQLAQDADLGATLAGDGPITLFAPTDAAFDELPADAVAQLRSDPALLERVLTHHLVVDRWPVSDLVAGPLPTMAGDDMAVDGAGDDLTVDGASIVEPDVLAANGVVHAIDAVLVPPDVDLTVPAQPAAVTATLAGGRYTLAGVVRSEVERSVLVLAATAAVGAGNVVDELLVDPDVGIDEQTAESLATLVLAVADSVTDGTAAFDGTSLVVTGTYADEAQRAALEEAAAAVGADISLVQRPPTDADDAVALETALNEFVVANPIRFDPNSSVLDESASPILDELARRVLDVPGVSITVEGHTDSDGVEQENLVLSRLRAIAVQEGLVERGLAPEAVSAEGFGSSQPILVDGAEDKAASRRVEFRVEIA